MKKLIQFKLKIFAKLILRKYQPTVIGVTGSVGKTGTKEAIYTVLSSKHNVRRNIKNYNNELGLPLTIIGKNSPGRNPFGWLGVGLRAWSLILFRDKNYPQILVLEMGIDHPGDMKRLLKIVRPTISIVTAIDRVHLEHFKKHTDLIQEKAALVEQLGNDGWAILNNDDEYVQGMKKNLHSKIITYGYDRSSDIIADHVRLSFKDEVEDVDNLAGVSYKVTYKGATLPVFLPNSLGVGPLYATLAAIAVGIIYGMNLVDITQILRSFVPPVGRMRLVEGIKGTQIIDDTYNASPRSTLAALEVLAKIPLQKPHRRYAILGDMLELGSVSVNSHKAVGKKVFELGVDVLIAVGERARDIARGAQAAGMNVDRVFMFPNANEAKMFVQRRIKKGDLILVKGSQGLRLEYIVKEIMETPAQAKKLLVRQEDEWLKK